MVKRYSEQGDFCTAMHADSNGDFVKYEDYAALEKQLAELQDKLRWRDVREELPPVGERIITYRPLANKSGDSVITIKIGESENRFCWPQTVPEGEEPVNYTDGACHCSHWLPLPDAPCSRTK